MSGNTASCVCMYIYQDPELNTKEAEVGTCECRVDHKDRIDKGSKKHRPSTLQGGEDYTVNKLSQAVQEVNKLFNEDRKIEMGLL